MLVLWRAGSMVAARLGGRWEEIQFVINYGILDACEKNGILDTTCENLWIILHR